ncbi:MAG: hypothetical protein Q8P81_02010 [Nanoarchaeota archaeon]|nr:hypothetical protein [Nanoarchaeota archaeon]
MGVFRSYPFATTLAVAGFLVGFSVFFSTSFFVSYDPLEISQQPIKSFIDYIKSYSSQLWSVLVKGMILGFILGIVLGLGGFMVDFLMKGPVANDSLRFGR